MNISREWKVMLRSFHGDGNKRYGRTQNRKKSRAITAANVPMHLQQQNMNPSTNPFRMKDLCSDITLMTAFHNQCAAKFTFFSLSLSGVHILSTDKWGCNEDGNTFLWGWVGMEWDVDWLT